MVPMPVESLIWALITAEGVVDDEGGSDEEAVDVAIARVRRVLERELGEHHCLDASLIHRAVKQARSTARALAPSSAASAIRRRGVVR